MKKAPMTKRILKALAHPTVDVLAHPTSRQIHKREPIEVDLEEVFHAAKEHHVAVELDAQLQRLDLNDVHVYRARELGVKIAIDTDAHSVDHLRFMSYGIGQARRGWREKGDVVNTLSWSDFQQWLQRKRRRGLASRRRRGGSHEPSGRSAAHRYLRLPVRSLAGGILPG
jgi:DNA polymerase (family 10)